MTESRVASRLVFQGSELDVRMDDVRLPSGQVIQKEVAVRPHSACMVPLDNEGNVLMVRQYRRAAGQTLLEVPAGKLDPGETPEQAALRELQEETGFTAAKLRRLSSFWLGPGWCTQFTHAFLVTELTPSRLTADSDEFITVEHVPLARIPELIAAGEIQDAKSIAALLLALGAVDAGNPPTPPLQRGVEDSPLS
jgi:ADP-ribose pyrophosphatase